MIGVIVINKPKNISSSKVVVKIKKLLNEKKVGHLGTLDPLASGVLPVCIGKATRLFDYFLKKRKTYIAQFSFGTQTDTLDLEGKVEKICEYIPTRKELCDAINDNFLGKIMQLPPDYSSKKINGQRAYDLARKGEEIKLSPKEIEIFDFKILQQKDEKTFEFEITCSSGTYIRSLARDLASSVKTCATMSNLIRTKSGDFCLENSLEFNNLTREQIEEKLFPLEAILKEFKKIEVNEEQLRFLRNGTRIDIFWAKSDDNDICVLCNKIVVGIGKIVDYKLKIETYFI
ncbi:MAG: tRNA pseudouridine(55) synthase TruB [Clostridia bacterium]|nr:tRNA pseudouridine(55) synthase TruB [Clostridia bacterium]